jgi:FMN phosphatase YigB (HAD superfamily)
VTRHGRAAAEIPQGIDKSQPAFFTRGRDRAGLPVARCLFVGEDERERRVAESAGFRTSPHPCTPCTRSRPS